MEAKSRADGLSYSVAIMLAPLNSMLIFMLVSS
jgi:hypothetical protein